MAPIALFVYRRPDCARAVLDSLLSNEQARDSDIFIFSDAAKTPQVAEDVEATRRIVREVSGFRNVTLVERSENYGLARSIVEGVTALCDAHGRVIVVEDDLVVSPDFLAFMNAGLEYYSSVDQVMQITGHIFPIEFGTSKDALFLPLISAWGWATWSRAWQHFDPQAKGYSLLRKDTALRQRFDLEDSYPYFAMLEKQLRGEIDSWAIRWYLSVFLRNGIVLHPKSNLIVNNGWGDSATHTTGNAKIAASSFGSARGGSGLPVPAVEEENFRKLVAFFQKVKQPDEWHPISAFVSKVAKLVRALRARF